MNSNLIFDVGMNTGDDTHYYLKLGYKVIAVEANPLLTSQATKTFSEFIKKGQLVIINNGIAKEHGVFDFWINNSNSEWSSFDYTLATKNNTPVSKIEIETITLSDLFIKYGTPYYLKIDIEGYDEFCLEQIDSANRPLYVSCEANTANLLDVLKVKGYTKFKMINQASGFSPFTRFSEGLYFPSLLRKIAWRLKTKVSSSKFGDSGPFAESTKGSWKTFEQIKKDFNFYYRGDDKPINKLSWYDFHATY